MSDVNARFVAMGYRVGWEDAMFDMRHWLHHHPSCPARSVIELPSAHDEGCDCGLSAAMTFGKRRKAA